LGAARPPHVINSGIALMYSLVSLQISDYKAPNFEAGNGLQQGTYLPKGQFCRLLKKTKLR